jgi:hypothetical protein
MTATTTGASKKRRITRADLLSGAEYERRRQDLRRAAIAAKRRRRMEVGPVATFYFENYDSMWLQVQEMLHIEKGGEAQIADELAAYNPLIPRGRELVATVMFEIDDPTRRAGFLATVGGIEHTAFIRLGADTIKGLAEADQERTSAEGKASSVQFIRFPFTAEQIARFRRPGAEIVVGFAHPGYAHMAAMPEPVRAALAEDFD